MNQWLQKILSESDSKISLIIIFLAFLCVSFLLIILLQSIRFSRKKAEIRKDAIKRSRYVRDGQMAEQIAPYLPDFPCKPEDARFIGKPFDFIAFPGLEENDSVKEILLIEVKTGNSVLTKREKEIRQAVAEGRVRYIEYRIEKD